MSQPKVCPVCGAESRARLARKRLTIFECVACSHRTAFHAQEALASDDKDYHAQYDTGAFLSSLERTRRRQALSILRGIRELAGPSASILDYGAGRGWFLKACREAGFREVAGADTSEIAVAGLEAAGIPAIKLPAREALRKQLPFGPQVVTFLDVIEHFPVDTLKSIVREVIEGLGPVRYVVIKVPDSAGILYRTAEAAARLGVDGPLEQLYQSGTNPPHFHYFSRRSLARFAESLGWEIAQRETDLDFEPAELFSRIHSLSRLPRPIGALPGMGFGAAAKALRMADSSICFLRVARHR